MTQKNPQQQQHHQNAPISKRFFKIKATKIGKEREINTI